MVNPFVNPKQRAIELPAGCKNLNDVLSKAVIFIGERPPPFKQGGLGDIGKFVRYLYEEYSNDKLLFILEYSRNLLLTVRYYQDSFNLDIMARSSDALMKEVILEFSGEAMPHPWAELNHFQSFRIKLLENSEDAAQVLIDFLLRAYNISEHDKFILSIQEQKVLPPGRN